MSPIVAFSLNRARDLLVSGGREEAVTRVGGIRRIVAVVQDSANKDTILVGRTMGDEHPTDLDTIVVALRAVLLHRCYPLVSIDPTERTVRTGQQIVRMEGGLEDSPFGRDFLALDVALKHCALGTLATDLVSYFDLLAKQLETSDGGGAARFWFEIAGGTIEEREGVFSFGGMSIAVRAQSVGFAGDSAADSFASAMTKSYPRMQHLIPQVARLQTLYDAVALAEGIRALDGDGLGYWLENYRVPSTPTPREYRLEARQHVIKTVTGPQTLRVSGGIQLRTILLRLKDGEVTALRDAVLLSRPGASSLTWPVPLADWPLVGEIGPVEAALADVVGSSFKWGMEPAEPTAPVYRPLELPPEGTLSEGIARDFVKASNSARGGSSVSSSPNKVGGISTGHELQDAEFGPIRPK